MVIEEIEKSIISALVIDFESNITYFKSLSDNDFNSEINKNIFKILIKMYDKKKKIDFISVLDTIKMISKNEKQKQNTVEYLIECNQNFVTSADIECKINLLNEYNAKKKISEIIQVTLNKLQDNEVDIFELKKFIIDSFDSIKNDNKNDNSETCSQALDLLLSSIEAGKSKGISTGFWGLDTYTRRII